ncbi:IclR family transcriptional regulator C-terminal domain-containing protein [Bradyrhizobium sp. LHD-71]|uniref:IclR family transcriptional regulator domain-containing protein n=1 Tax=Bradyrhizobium sp. LHD-71 TaxID=3072141 RepID=UPI00280DFEE6|nr:IclR family transcriptional regulator C-terminal domain-containing protein [Bradyrhizobium sp. LHD-71]MDQ8727382.1 IclR family transcriptional regulator C-terminal domain-containing protein [Bradyrhizobium sp. LHD-71]
MRITISIGTTTVVSAGASGKCFMAFLPRKESDQLLTHVPISAITASTVTAKKEFRKGLERTREDGYAIVFGEAIAGANGIAAPIFDANGRVAFVVTIVGVALNLPLERAKAIGQELRAATDRITLQTGGLLPSE